MGKVLGKNARTIPSGCTQKRNYEQKHETGIQEKNPDLNSVSGDV